MKMKWISAVLILAACTTGTSGYESYGEEISATSAMNTDDFIATVSNDSKSYKVEGVIEEVCQMKGCWMTLRNEQGANVRVTFKDYGFFVPKDISGKKVVIEGTAAKEILDEDVARHYAEDGNKEYDESMRNSISFVAHGVLVAKT